MPIFDIALFTHRGTVRARNEDAIFAGGTIYQEDLRDVIAMHLAGGQHVLLVADGIGGRPEGAFASRTTLQLLSSDIRLLDGPSGCENALHAVNARLYELMNEPTRIGMGTTVVGLLLQDEGVIGFNVGDSRAYRIHRAGLVKLSREDVASDGSHAITQALGGSTFPLAILPHVYVGPSMQVGERFLLCTDGLTDALDDTEIAALLHSSASASAIAHQLVRQAISAGSRDNISVVVGTCLLDFPIGHGA